MQLPTIKHAGGELDPKAPSMLELKSLQYHPATAAEPVLRGLDLSCRWDSPP